MGTHPIKDRIEEVSGKVKEVTGKVFGDKSLERKGEIEKNDGKAKVGFDKLKSKVEKRV